LKNRKLISLFIYIAVLVLAFSWMLGLFGTNDDGLAYSQVVSLFQQKQVRSFVVKDNYIHMVLHEPFEGKTNIVATLADPEGFHQEMGSLLQQQSNLGVLEEYDFVPDDETSPFDYIIPIIIAGLVLLLVWAFLVGRSNANNPMANFGKARTVLGQTGGKKVTFNYTSLLNNIQDFCLLIISLISYLFNISSLSLRCVPR